MKYIISLLAFAFSAFASAQTPDIILHHGKIFTSEKSRLYIEALAITGDKISATGKNDDILKLKGPGTKLIDLGGKTVVPGFNDAHNHTAPEYPSRNFESMKMPGDPTPWEKIKDSISKITREVPTGTLIRTSIDPELLDDLRVRRKNLDSIAPEHPVLLSAWTGHGVIANSKALALIGFTERSNFLGGTLQKGVDGKLNGILEEYAGYRIPGTLAEKLPMDVVIRDLQGYYQEALSFGITSEQVMAAGMKATTFSQVFANHDFGIRTRIIAFPFTNEKELLLSEWSPLFKSISSKNIVSGVKLIIDGTPAERLAGLTQPYTDRPGFYGRINFDDRTIQLYVDFCLKHKQQILVHAVGDSAIHHFIRLLRDMHPAAFWKDKRVRIEHGDMGIMKVGDYSTLKEMGIIIVQNPTHFAIPQLMAQRLGGRAPKLQAMRTLINSDIPLAIGSDGPINPFLNLMLAAMHPNNPVEALSLEDAVIAYTYGSAYAEFMETKKGTLTEGKLADLAVLSQDIFTIPLPALMGTRCLMTMIGGKIVYEAKSE